MDAVSQSPYEILNLPETATREEIDTAYSKLMSRFSEENYLGSPLCDLAAEKRRNIQSAYQRLTDAATDAVPHSSPSEPTESNTVSYRVRNLLNQGKLHEADVLLREQPDCDNNPELLYLRGVCAWKRGWLDEASRLVRRAADAVPTNREYQNAVEKFCVKSKPITGSKKAESRCCSRFDFAACSAECCCECVCEGICDSIDC